MRVLILSWEYPPIVEGGLARHVRKLAEGLVQNGVEVHVLARGGGRLQPVEDRHGVTVHRVREPEFPKDDLDAFVRLGRRHERRHARGRRRARRLDLVRPRALPRLAGGRRGAQARAALQVPVARDRARDRARPPPGLGEEAPAEAHPRRRAADGAGRGPGHHLLALHARPRRRGVRDRRGEDHRGAERGRPRGPPAGREPAQPARPLRAAGRAARAAGGAARLREGLPPRARRPAGRDRAGGERALPGRRLRHRGARPQGAGARSSGCCRTASSSAGSTTRCCTRSTRCRTCA